MVGRTALSGSTSAQTSAVTSEIVGGVANDERKFLTPTAIFHAFDFGLCSRCSTSCPLVPGLNSFLLASSSSTSPAALNSSATLGLLPINPPELNPPNFALSRPSNSDATAVVSPSSSNTDPAGLATIVFNRSRSICAIRSCCRPKDSFRLWCDVSSTTAAAAVPASSRTEAEPIDRVVVCRLRRDPIHHVSNRGSKSVHTDVRRT